MHPSLVSGYDDDHLTGQLVYLFTHWRIPLCLPDNPNLRIIKCRPVVSTLAPRGLTTSTEGGENAVAVRLRINERFEVDHCGFTIPRVQVGEVGSEMS